MLLLSHPRISVSKLKSSSIIHSRGSQCHRSMCMAGNLSLTFLKEWEWWPSSALETEEQLENWREMQRSGKVILQ